MRGGSSVCRVSAKALLVTSPILRVDIADGSHIFVCNFRMGSVLRAQIYRKIWDGRFGMNLQTIYIDYVPLTLIFDKINT
jgi:hypothetical protein